MRRNNPYIHFVLIIIFIILQSALFTKIGFLPAYPDFAFVVLIFSSISLGSAKASTIGFISGMVLDFLSFSPLGFFALIYALVGYILGKTKGKFFIDPVLVPIIITIICCLVRSLLAAFLGNIFMDGGNFLSNKFLIETGFNLVTAPIVIAFMKLFKILSFIEQDHKL